MIQLAFSTWKLSLSVRKYMPMDHQNNEAAINKQLLDIL